MSNQRRRFHPKWAGPNTPFIRISGEAGVNEERLYLSKQELMDLKRELDRFVEHYADDFSEGRILIQDDHDFL